MISPYFFSYFSMLFSLYISSPYYTRIDKLQSGQTSFKIKFSVSAEFEYDVNLSIIIFILLILSSFQANIYNGLSRQILVYSL